MLVLGLLAEKSLADTGALPRAEPAANLGTDAAAKPTGERDDCNPCYVPQDIDYELMKTSDWQHHLSMDVLQRSSTSFMKASG